MESQDPEQPSEVNPESVTKNQGDEVNEKPKKLKRTRAPKQTKAKKMKTSKAPNKKPRQKGRAKKKTSDDAIVQTDEICENLNDFQSIPECGNPECLCYLVKDGLSI